jgi:hypothetical protein
LSILIRIPAVVILVDRFWMPHLAFRSLQQVKGMESIAWEGNDETPA